MVGKSMTGNEGTILTYSVRFFLHLIEDKMLVEARCLRFSSFLKSLDVFHMADCSPCEAKMLQ